MKKISIFAALLAVLCFFGAEAQKTKPTIAAVKKATTIDVAKSTVVWVGKKVTGEHTGNISIKSGSLSVSGASLVGGEVVIDMNTITCTDLKDAEYSGKLVGHLKADDFFGTEANPTSTLKITSVKPIKGAKLGANNSTVGGTITIKGVSQPVSFPAMVTVGKGGKLAAKGVITVDRTKFGVKYGSKSFFEGLGDKTIYDDFTLSFDVVSQ